MPKRVAVIDIGSNSIRLVIFQRTSRFGFHLINQLKSDARISEGSFENGGYLQESAIQRAIEALATFKEVIAEYKARKSLIIATAAVRNAPNRYQFLKRVRDTLKINIKVINGDREAFLSAFATKNLLPIDSAISVDIGGGSSDIALIENGKVVDTFSIDIGTITIKELFFDKGRGLKEAREFIKKEISKLPDKFKGDRVVAIGGVLRALAKSIIKISNYSFKKIHSFEYNFNEFDYHIRDILNAKDSDELRELHIKESRFDTIKGGVLIFQELLNQLKIDRVITSGVGLREGVFLYDMLRGVGGQFPKELNPSLVSINDRFDLIQLPLKYKTKIAKSIFNTIYKPLEIDNNYLKHLLDAIKISNIGKSLTVYNAHKHAYYIASQELNWRYTHKDMLLIAIILRSSRDKLLYKPLREKHKELLPQKRDIKLLSFIYLLSDTLFSYSYKIDYKFNFKDNTLTIETDRELPLFKRDISKFKLPIKGLKIELKALNS